MLFRKKIPKDCAYCEYGTSLNNSQILCSKKGIRPSEKPCAGFTYDPLKRIPPKQKALDLNDFNSVDFELN